MMKATIMCVAIEAIRAHPLVGKKLVGGVAAWLNTESLQPPQGAKVPPRDHLVPPQEKYKVTLQHHSPNRIFSCWGKNKH